MYLQRKVVCWLHEFQKWHGLKKRISSLLLTETMTARDVALFVHEQQVPAVEIEDDAL